jgi:predicted nucleotide-binding protein
MTDALESFLGSIPDVGSLLAKHQDAVAVFGYFLSAVAGEAITPGSIANCYDAAHVKAPRNISDIMGKSKAFVRTKDGWVLQRDTVARLKLATPGASKSDNGSNSERVKTVMVVYGRDDTMRTDIFNLLRALDLKPVEWNDAVRKTGKASPYVGDILTAAFAMAQAFLVLMTPDEEVKLRPGLRSSPHEDEAGLQARPNVLLEAGMALATDEARTILVEVGSLRGMSDLTGRHVIRLNNSPARRNDLVQRLRIAGCVPNTGGTDWITLGDFER